MLVGNAGVLITRVLYLKTTGSKKFVVVDAGMNDSCCGRPSMKPITKIRPVVLGPPPHPWSLLTWSGRSANSGDFLARDRELPELHPGDLLAIMSAGAYGAVQSSTYNTRALVPEVLVKGSAWALVRKRISPEEVIEWDRLPAWF